MFNKQYLVNVGDQWKFTWNSGQGRIYHVSIDGAWGAIRGRDMNLSSVFSNLMQPLQKLFDQGFSWIIKVTFGLSKL